MMKPTDKWLIVRKFHTVGNACLSYTEWHEPPIGIYYIFAGAKHMCSWEDFKKVLDAAPTPA